VGVDFQKYSNIKFNGNPLSGCRFKKKYSNVKFNENLLGGCRFSRNTHIKFNETSLGGCRFLKNTQISNLMKICYVGIDFQKY
jgi:hypothetical protein